VTTSGPKAMLPDERLDKHIDLRLNQRETDALQLVAKDMGLSPQEAIRSLIMSATLDIKPKPKKARTL